MDINELLKQNELHMEQVLRAKLCELGFPPHALRVLKGNGITTLGDLCGRSKKELLEMRFLGATNVEAVDVLLRSMDLSLRP